MLGDFTVKNVNLERENLYLTENRLSGNEMWCVADSIICVTYVQKGVSDSNLN